jgi:hypothetical protein
MFTLNNTNTRFDILMQKTHINFMMCDRSAGNALGRAYALVDMPVYGSLGMSLSDFRPEDKAWMRFWWAVCMSTEELMFGCLVNKRQPAPAPDEYFFDIGAPLSPRSLGTLDDDGTFTRRAPDDGTFYFTLFENGYVWFCLAEPPDQSSWPIVGTTYTATNLPTPPAGKVARRLDSATYVHPGRGYGPHNLDPDVNDGGLVGGQIEAFAWSGGLVIWADS